MNLLTRKSSRRREKGISAEEVLNELLCQSPPGAMGLVVQPYWSPGLSEPAAKGAMIGFGDVHKKPHIYRAVIEGLVFALKEGKEKIEKVSKKENELAVSGGASQSDEICQIAADIFNLPIVTRRKQPRLPVWEPQLLQHWEPEIIIQWRKAYNNMVYYER